MKKLILGFLICFLSLTAVASDTTAVKSPFIVILGVAQDAGYPQIGCTKQCCQKVWKDPTLKRFVTSFALADPIEKKWWLFEATPDIKDQLELFQRVTKSGYSFLPAGIFLTHGHIGHYTGLMELGREAMNAAAVPLYVLPRMKEFLTNNGPWSLLVQLNNISLLEMKEDSSFSLNDRLSVNPFLVPHRDEFTETAGFSIQTKNKQVIFIPDIDKWEKFERNIDSLIRQSTLAFLDGTFYKENELEGRSMSEIPHPFIVESMKRFNSLSPKDKRKIFFIHFNHTNPLLNRNSKEFKKVTTVFNIADQASIIIL